MAWVKIDDQFADHPKIREVGAIGIAIQVSILCYCNRFLTDGLVSNKIATTIIKSLTKERGWIDRMVDAGLWHKLDNGDILVHDYLEYNPSKKDAIEIREKRVEAGKLGANAKQSAKQTMSKTQAKDVAKVCPDPDPLPEPFSKSIQSNPIQSAAPRNPDGADGRKDGFSIPVFGQEIYKNGTVTKLADVLPNFGDAPMTDEEFEASKRRADAALKAEKLRQQIEEREFMQQKEHRESLEWTDKFAELIPNCDDETKDKLFKKIKLINKELLQPAFDQIQQQIEITKPNSYPGYVLKSLANIV